GRHMLNGYGTSENTVAISTNVFGPDTSPKNIGRPIENVHCYVLDQGLQPVPIGVPGDLYVAGVGVSSGYLNRPELTAQCFFPNPYFQEALRNPIMYKTGDLVRRLKNGDMEFIGRVDFQVKIRGHRIECDEVGTAIGNLEGVKSCLVLPIPQGATHRLIAYLIPEAGTELDIGALREMTADLLPNYMVPAAFVVLKEFPRTPNGKVDRRALPIPEGGGERDNVAYVKPRNALEETLCKVWSQTLGVEEVGVKEDFFHLGGDSLSCMEMLAAAEEVGLRMQVTDVREHSTVENLAAHLKSQSRSVEDPGFPEPVTAQGLGAFPMPRNALMMHRLEESMRATGAAVEAMPTRWDFFGPLNREALREALRFVIGRFDTFRLRVEERDGGVWLTPLSGDLTPAWEAIDPADLDSTMSAWSMEPLKTTEPSCQFRLFDLGGDCHALCLRGTHLLFDAWSSEVLLDALASAYNAFCAGTTPKEPPATSLRTFTEWYHRLIDDGYLQKSQAFWTAEMAQSRPLYPSPPRPCAKRNPYQCLTAMKPIPAERMNQLKTLCQAHRGTLFEGCLTVYQLMLAKRSQDNRPLTAFVTALRDRKALQSVIGSLTNRMYFSTEVPQNRAFSETLNRVKKGLIAVQNHSYWPVWEAVDPHGLGVPDLFFHYVARSDGSGPNFQGVTLKQQPLAPPQYWSLGLALQVIDHNEHPTLLCMARAGFCDELFLEEFMEDYLACLDEVLQASN
ncbi:MAG: condensation domain-containing protein, partial [Desulfuromonas sp.]|nr:condensation domain-containing protein [Desulfuromonas sp.]